MASLNPRPRLPTVCGADCVSTVWWFQAPQYLHVATISPADLHLDHMLLDLEQHVASQPWASAAALPPPRQSTQLAGQSSITASSSVATRAAAELDGRWSSAALLEAEAGGGGQSVYATPWQVRVTVERESGPGGLTREEETPLRSDHPPSTRRTPATSKKLNCLWVLQNGSNAAQDIATTRDQVFGARAAAEVAAERSTARRVAARAAAAAVRFLGGAKSSLGDVKSSLGDATSSLNDAKRLAG
jgi:hypothetical protein